MKLTASKGKLILIFLGCAGIFGVCLGSLLTVYYDDILRFFMERELVLEEGHEFYDIWTDIPLPIFEKIYIFNITNPIEVAQGQRAKVDELGPYVFRGHWYKTDMKWDEESVTYRDHKDYEFVPELSSGTQDEEIYCLNYPVLAVVNYVEDYSPFFLRSLIIDMVNGIFASYNQTLVLKRTVKQMVYEGYHEKMVGDLTKVLEPFITLPYRLINETFGLLHERKIVGDGVFHIKSGRKGIRDYTSIIDWNNVSTVDWWSNDDSHKCNEVGGVDATDGIQFAPFVTKNHSLKLFNPLLCRVMTLEYKKDITVHGIKALRFGFSKSMHKCHCTGPYCNEGLHPISCKPGAPFVFSYPHLLDADPSLLNEVSDMKPDAEKHMTYVDVEALTGFSLNAAFRMQLNGVTRPMTEYKLLENLTTNALVPVLWMSAEAQIDGPFAAYFKRRVSTPLVIFKVLTIMSLVLGSITAVAALAFGLCIYAKLKPEALKQASMIQTLNSVYTSVALWPLPEDDIKGNSDNEKTKL